MKEGGGEGEGRPLLRNSTETLATQARKELFHQLFLTCSLIGPIVPKNSVVAKCFDMSIIQDTVRI